jgi:hypothetical protein
LLLDGKCLAFPRSKYPETDSPGSPSQGASTASGCQPEKVAWFDANDPSAFENITIIESGVQQGPTRRLMRGSPPGTKWLDKRYLGRPETIESVFYMSV